MKSKDLFHFTIVFFMVVAITLLGGYEYVYSDIIPDPPSTMQLVTQYSAMPGYASQYGSRFVNPDYLYPSSLTIAPSITQSTIPSITQEFIPGMYWMSAQWSSDYYYKPSIQAQISSLISDTFYNLTDRFYTQTGIMYNITSGKEGWSGYPMSETPEILMPITRNWNVYQQTDLYALPGSSKHRLYEFTKEFEVGPRMPDIWTGIGGGYGQ